MNHDAVTVQDVVQAFCNGRSARSGALRVIDNDLVHFRIVVARRVADPDLRYLFHLNRGHYTRTTTYIQSLIWATVDRAQIK